MTTQNKGLDVSKATVDEKTAIAFLKYMVENKKAKKEQVNNKDFLDFTRLLCSLTVEQFKSSEWVEDAGAKILYKSFLEWKKANAVKEHRATRIDKKSLYESIMTKIAPIVKKALIESLDTPMKEKSLVTFKKTMNESARKDTPYNAIIKILEDNDFSVHVFEDESLELETYTDYGQDYVQDLDIKKSSSKEEILDSLWGLARLVTSEEYIEEQADLWSEEGDYDEETEEYIRVGINGAPQDYEDIKDDMRQGGQKIMDIYNIALKEL